MQNRVIPVEEFRRKAGSLINPYLSVIIEQRSAAPQDMVFTISEWRDEPTPRSVDSADYARFLVDRALRLMPPNSGGLFPRSVVFQGDDTPVACRSISWQSRKEWSTVNMVPDLYFYLYEGYRAKDAIIPKPWNDRRHAFIWRGSTTGQPNMPASMITRLKRYQLCSIASKLGDDVDVKFTAVVQAMSEYDHEEIAHRLHDEGLTGSFIPMEAMDDWQFIIDIDGNASSWNFMAKLRLGCCVLKVESEWCQWFSADLKPWEHYVPIASDLSDVGQKLEWCRAHDGEAAAIGERGRRFALDRNFERELDRAAITMGELLLDETAWLGGP